jgi:hypothetical protein
MASAALVLARAWNEGAASVSDAARAALGPALQRISTDLVFPVRRCRDTEEGRPLCDACQRRLADLEERLDGLIARVEKGPQ